jgi:hypothetical protein
MAGVVSGSAIAHADVQISVRPEHEVPSVVVRKGLSDERVASAPTQVESGARVGHEQIRRSPESRNDGVAGLVGEVDEDPAVWRDRHPEQATLPSRGDRIPEIEKVRREDDAVADHANAAGLLHDVLHRAIGGVLKEQYRRREARSEDPATQLGLRVQADREGRHENRQPARTRHPSAYPCEACRSFGSIASRSACAAMCAFTIPSALATASASPLR